MKVYVYKDEKLVWVMTEVGEKIEVTGNVRIELREE